MPGRGEPPGSLTMSRVTSLVHIISIVATFALVGADSARAVEEVVTGVLGSYTSGVWPILIGMKKGFFAKRGIEIDAVFVPSAPGLVQQLAWRIERRTVRSTELAAAWYIQHIGTCRKPSYGRRSTSG